MAGLGFVTSSKVVLPAHDGSLCILPGHAPMVGLLGHGELVVTSRAARIPSNKQLDRTFEIKEGTEYRMYVSGGTFQVMDNEVLILPEQGFLPTQLRLDDLELEENRQAAQVRASEENLEGESLNAMFLEAKKKEVAELRKSTETLKPSTEKEAEMNRIRAMEKVLG